MVDDHTVLGRTLAVIDACLVQITPVSLAQLTKSTGLPKATVRRIAEDLVCRHLLERTEDGYLSGCELAWLAARAARQQEAVRQNVMPYLHELHGRTRAVVCVVRTDSATRWSIMGTIYDHDAAASGYAESWPCDGSIPAVLASAVGQVALALDRAHAESLMRAGVPRMTRYTARHPLQLGRALDRAATNGEAVEHEGLVEGWSCLAVPVARRAGATPAAVLAVVNRSERFDTKRYLCQAHLTAQGIERSWLTGPQLSLRPDSKAGRS